MLLLLWHWHIMTIVQTPSFFSCFCSFNLCFTIIIGSLNRAAKDSTFSNARDAVDVRICSLRTWYNDFFGCACIKQQGAGLMWKYLNLLYMYKYCLKKVSVGYAATQKMGFACKSSVFSFYSLTKQKQILFSQIESVPWVVTLSAFNVISCFFTYRSKKMSMIFFLLSICLSANAYLLCP